MGALVEGVLVVVALVGALVTGEVVMGVVVREFVAAAGIKTAREIVIYSKNTLKRWKEKRK